MDAVIKWDNISFIISSSYRSQILKKLREPSTPSKLSKELNINKTHVSRALSELISKDIIKCLTPNSTKGKLYIITNYGSKLLNEINKNNF